MLSYVPVVQPVLHRVYWDARYDLHTLGLKVCFQAYITNVLQLTVAILYQHYVCEV
jgi:hypothetical protein